MYAVLLAHTPPRRFVEFMVVRYSVQVALGLFITVGGLLMAAFLAYQVNIYANIGCSHGREREVGFKFAVCSHLPELETRGRWCGQGRCHCFYTSKWFAIPGEGAHSC